MTSIVIELQKSGKKQIKNLPLWYSGIYVHLTEGREDSGKNYEELKDLIQ